jgi:hypothetical protein
MSGRSCAVSQLALLGQLLATIDCFRPTMCGAWFTGDGIAVVVRQSWKNLVRTSFLARR